MTVIGKQSSLGYPAIGVMPPGSPMAEDDPREQIAKLELHIERLAEVAERCRKFMLAARIAILFGGTLLAALVLRVLGFDPVTMVVGITATIGGVVVLGSNSSTLQQTEAAIQAAEALRSQLIAHIELRLVSNHPEL